MFLLGAILTLATAYALGVALFRKLPLPGVVLFGLGAIAGSMLAFLLFIADAGKFLPALFVTIPLAFVLRRPAFEEPAAEPVDRLTRWIVLPILSVFGVFYLVHALAPEIQSDAISYHLGLVAEYLRKGGFPNRVGFYEVLPQGMEMLFAPAYRIGGATAAKLVHFAFLLATIPLIVLTARRLKLSDGAGYSAAALYFLAPVVGISGTSAYNDAALVFFTLASFYLLLLWRDTNILAYAAGAGLTAGFCYSIKFTGIIVAPLAVIFILWHRRAVRAVVYLSIPALVMIAPWMWRAYYMTGNPLAPLFNSWFPNIYFNPITEKELSTALSMYPAFRWPTALWTWAFGGAAQGVVGPLILAAPLALLALRKPAGRLLLAAAALLLAPIAFNVGTRFLMPALPFLALALACALPRPALLPVVVLQAVLCFPPVLLKLEDPYTWALHTFPWQAALRLQSESDYLQSVSNDYRNARFLESHTTPKDRIFALSGIAKAYATREIAEYWHSNRNSRLTFALQMAYVKPLAVKTRAEWPAVALTAIRFTSTTANPGEWTIFESRLFSPGGFLYASPQWNLNASQNYSDSPGAFDGNLATFWSTRIPQRPGMFLEADFDQPELVNAAEFTIAANAAQPGFAVEGRLASNGKWQRLTDRFNGKVIDLPDLRIPAIRSLKKAGFTAISMWAYGGGLGVLAQDMVDNASKWGLTDLGSNGPFHIMRID